MTEPRKILIIQTASIGDVILATPLVESLSEAFPSAVIDFLVKKGVESLLFQHPKIREVKIWNKKRGKFTSLMQVIADIRKEKYDMVVNAQRFLATGVMTAFSGAALKIGFDKNPLSFLFDRKTPHVIGIGGVHEVDRNLSLISDIVTPARRVRLYPPETDFQAVSVYKDAPYICLAPASLWFTKQFPEERWIEFINAIQKNIRIYLLGSRDDQGLCQRIIAATGGKDTRDLSGQLTMLQSAALMKDARMNYTNDSAPMHLAASVNAPVTAIFCSTVTDFGFGPLSDNSYVAETREALECRPCGLHGHNACPRGHFRCAYEIDMKELMNRL